MTRQSNQEAVHNEFVSSVTRRSAEELAEALLSDEKEILHELARDLRGIRYGSIVLVIHEGRLVEVTKTVRIRKGRADPDERQQPQRK